MEISKIKMPFFLFFSVLFLAILPNPSHSATVLVDGIKDWKDPNVTIGDSIIFRHKDHYTLYIFRTKSAFIGCDFTQATPLTNSSSSSYTWNPSRLGQFYFSFSNGTEKPCQNGQKLSVKVIPAPAKSPPAPVSEPPTPGGEDSSSPAFPWPFRPREKSGGTPAPTTAMAPVVSGGGGSMPFIDSNPVVPLPAGEVDSDTIRPLPTSADKNHAIRGMQVVKLLGHLIITQCIVIFLLMM